MRRDFAEKLHNGLCKDGGVRVSHQISQVTVGPELIGDMYKEELFMVIFLT
jgi:hypothetical protein